MTCSATGGRGSNPLVWLVFVQRPSFNARCYRRQRFKPCGLISVRLRVLISASGRGSNPLACRTGFIWLLFLSSPKPEPYVLVQTSSIWTAMPADADL